MTENSLPLSDAVVQWASLDGHTSLRHRDGVWSFYNGSDIEVFLHVDGSLFTVTTSERNGPERFDMRSSSIRDVERYLVVTYGSDYRSGQHMPVVRCAHKANDLKPGWRVNSSPGEWSLYDPSGLLRACFYDDDAIWFSWIADASIEDIMATYKDPEGLPLAPGLWIGPPREKMG